MKIRIHFSSSVVLFLIIGFHINVEAQITTLICNYEEGGYFGTVNIDMKKKMLTETDELTRLITENIGGKYDPEKHFRSYPIAYVSDALIRTSKVEGVEIEIDRRSLRMRWLRPAPPEWRFNCVKAEKAF